jgi:hypothetical protein
MNGSLAPPPPYGSEQGSILLESGQRAPPAGRGEEYFDHGRGREQRHHNQQPTSPGPARDPGEIGLTDIAQHSNNEVVVRVHEPPPPDYSSQTSSSGGEDEEGDERQRSSTTRAQQERERLLGNAPAYRDIVRERSPGNGGRWRSGSAPAGPSVSRD